MFSKLLILLMFLGKANEKRLLHNIVYYIYINIKQIINTDWLWRQCANILAEKLGQYAIFYTIIAPNCSPYFDLMLANIFVLLPGNIAYTCIWIFTKLHWDTEYMYISDWVDGMLQKCMCARSKKIVWENIWNIVWEQILWQKKDCEKNDEKCNEYIFVKK